MLKDRISRRVLLRRAALTAGILGTAAVAGSCEGPAAETAPPPSAATAPPGKLTKAQVAYQYQPNGYQKCGLCANFLAPDQCRLVEGSISPNGWCKQYKPRSG